MPQKIVFADLMKRSFNFKVILPANYIQTLRCNVCNRIVIHYAASLIGDGSDTSGKESESCSAWGTAACSNTCISIFTLTK